MQPVGSISNGFGDSLTLFSEKSFGSVAIPVINKAEAEIFSKQFVQSLILIGKSQWTILDSEDQTYCISANSNFMEVSAVPVICPVPDLRLTVAGQSLKIVAVRHGCSNQSDEKTINVEIENCDYFDESDQTGELSN